MSTLYPSGFVETGYPCDGPRYIRNQPSRESGGILLDEKYGTDWNLPYKNLLGFVKQINNQWDRLNDEQKKIITDMISIIIIKHPDILSNEMHQNQKSQLNSLKELFSNEVLTVDQILSAINHDPNLLYSTIDKIYHPTTDVENIFGNSLKDIQYNLTDKFTTNNQQTYNMKLYVWLIIIIIGFFLGIIIGKYS